MKATKKLLVIGLGVLGSNILDMVTRTHTNHELIFAGKDLNKIKERVNLSELVANKLGYYPKVSVLRIDLHDISKTTEVIHKIRPDVIFNATSLMSYWVPTTLPEEIFSKLYYAFTGWQTPVHLTLTYKLMQAIKLAGLKVRVINASYPDVVNCALAGLGLKPDIGIGNVSNVLPAVKKAISINTSLDVQDIDVYIIGHHHYSYMLPTIGNSNLPHHIVVYYKEKNITSRLNLNEIYGLIPTKLKRTRGMIGMSMTAASAMNVIRECLNEEGNSIHAPGVKGLPGGYPVKINKLGINLDLPEELGLEKAIEINRMGQVLDGVKDIKDGVITYTTREMDIVKDLIGYQCNSMKVEDSEYWAEELIRKFYDFKDKLEYKTV